MGVPLCGKGCGHNWDVLTGQHLVVIVLQKQLIYLRRVHGSNCEQLFERKKAKVAKEKTTRKRTFARGALF